MSALRRNHFTIAYADRTAGRIVTQPETSKQWFEFWRSDAPGGYQVLESSLHTIRRVVTIDLIPHPRSAGRVAGAIVTSTDDPPAGRMTEVRDRPSIARDTPKAAASPPQPQTGSMTPIGRPEPSSPPRPVPAVTPQMPAPLGVAPTKQGEYQLTVTVEKSRFSAPDRQVTTSAGALRIYSEALPTTEGLRAGRSEAVAWVPLGRDGLLEANLLDRLTHLDAVRNRAELPASGSRSGGSR